MKIYTKFGDTGNTQILGGVKLSKSDCRIDCIGEIDELNSTLGVSISSLINRENGDSGIAQELTRVQNELFQWGAMLAGASPERQTLPDENSIEKLENEIDQWQESLPVMTHFILPGGSSCGASLHYARAVCRRCERRVMMLSNELSGASDTELDSMGMLQIYLNRLGDWLFVAARTANHLAGVPETKWIAQPD